MYSVNTRVLWCTHTHADTGVLWCSYTYMPIQEFSGVHTQCWYQSSLMRLHIHADTRVLWCAHTRLILEVSDVHTHTNTRVLWCARAMLIPEFSDVHTMLISEFSEPATHKMLIPEFWFHTQWSYLTGGEAWTPSQIHLSYIQWGFHKSHQWSRLLPLVVVVQSSFTVTVPPAIEICCPKYGFVNWAHNQGPCLLLESCINKDGEQICLWAQKYC